MVRGGHREGSYAGKVVMGTMDAVVASELHATAMTLQQSKCYFMRASDADPTQPGLHRPSHDYTLVESLYAIPRISDKSRTAIIESLGGRKRRQSGDGSRQHPPARCTMGANAAKSVLEAKTAVLAHDGYNGHHAEKHVWWYTWSIKSSGKVNETTLYRTLYWVRWDS